MRRGVRLHHKLQDDGKYHMAVNDGADQLFLKYAVEHPLTPGRGSLVGRTALERKTVHMPDCLADPEYVALEYQSVGHYRSNLGVPLLREGSSNRRNHFDAGGGDAIYRKADRAGHDLCRPGRNRHRKRPAVRRGAGANARPQVAGAADSDLGGS